MERRLIDANELFDFLTDQLDKETGFYSKGRNAGLNVARSALLDETITPTIAPPPNDPLTLEELREMDGEPVWCCNPHYTKDGHWAIIRNDKYDVPEYNHCAYAVGICWPISEYGKTWLAYRRKPEEGTT